MSAKTDLDYHWEGLSQTTLNFLYDNMTFLEQFVEGVINYSSKYNSMSSIFYAPENLIGKPSKYPTYGDFPDTYILRSYGKWWLESEAAQPVYMLQEVDPIPTEDFVIVRFEYSVFPSKVCIYETYNPGAVVRLWGRKFGNPWVLLWKGDPEICPMVSRKFCPQIRPVKELINEIRVDFHQAHLRYHTSIDAILLTGYQPKSLLQMSILDKNFLASFCNVATNKPSLEYHQEEDQKDFFGDLPFEIMLHIFTYLDLKSLCRCAQVSKMWHLASSDPSLYRGISFKRYWHKVDNSVIEQYTTRCNNIKKLDLSWCSTENQIKEVVFVRFLKKSCRMVTHLSLDCCSFIHTLSLQQIGICKNLTDLRLRNCKSNYKDFGELAQLNKLIALDLYSSNIVDEELISILKSNRNLKYLIIDFCEYLESLDEVTLVASLYNSQLVTWSSWKTHSLTAEGVCHLANCTSLKELDLGWCLILNEPGNCLERISHGCKDLTRLIISGWRGITERHLLPIIQSCRHLSQLDLLGVKNVSRDICDRILKSLPKLKLLDISFCDLIRMEEVALWEEQYPYVVIQH